jgi:hypothetical protein
MISKECFTAAWIDEKSTLPNRLSRLKRQSPEAFFYWAKTSELL